MRFTACVVLLSLVAALPRSVRADDEVGATADTPPAQVGAVPLMKGEPAPIDGVLIPEEMFIGYLKLDLRLKEAELKVEARDRALSTIELELAKAKTPQPRTWWERNQFYAGAATTLLLIIGGAQAIDRFR